MKGNVEREACRDRKNNCAAIGKQCMRTKGAAEEREVNRLRINQGGTG